jgi:hypothetical protein
MLQPMEKFDEETIGRFARLDMEWGDLVFFYLRAKRDRDVLRRMEAAVATAIEEIRDETRRGCFVKTHEFIERQTIIVEGALRKLVEESASFDRVDADGRGASDR